MFAMLRSNCHGSRIVGVMLALSGIALGTPALCQGGWITATAGMQYRVIDDGKTKNLPIPVTLKDVKPAGVRLRVIAVRLDNVLLPELLPDAFKVPSALTHRDAASQTIELEVNTKLASRWGTYEVWIEANAANAQKHGAEILKISVEHPAASLRTPGKLTAEVVRGTVREDRFEVTPLSLELTSDVSRVSNPVLGAIRFPGEIKPISGSLTLAKPLVDLDLASKPIYLPWTMTGEFPLGVTEAETEIRAAQLKDPVAVKVSIRSRRSLTWLWFATILGLALGWALKSWLESYLQLGRARREGARVRDVIEEQLRRYPDTEFEEKLRSCCEELGDAVRGKDAAAITNAATDAQTKLTAELTKLQEGQQTLRTTINTWLTAVSPKRELPDALLKVAATANRELREAAITLKSDCTSAKTKVDEITQSLLLDLKTESARWKEGMKSGLGELSDPERLTLPRAVADHLAAASNEITKTLLDLINTEPVDGPTIGALLEAVDRLRRQVLIGVIEPTDAAVSRVANRVLQTLEGAGALPSAVRDGTRAVVSAVGNLLSQGSVEERLKALAPGAAQELRDFDAWFRKMVSNVQVGDIEAQKQIAALVKARDYEGAARRAAEAKTAVATGEAEDVKLDKRVRPTGAPVSGSVEAAASAGTVLGLAKAVPERWVDLVASESIMPAAQVHVTVAQAERQIRIAQAAQSVVVGALFLVVAHVTYAEKYLGTFSELAAVFFWAFGLDVTVSKLIEAAKGLGTPSSGR